jgi:hypothetical protein
MINVLLKLFLVLNHAHERKSIKSFSNSTPCHAKCWKKISCDGRKVVENYTMPTVYRNLLENSIVGKEKLWENSLCLKEIVGKYFKILGKR